MKWSLFCARRRLSGESGESLMEGSHFGLPASFLTHSGFVRKRTQSRARCHAAPFSSSDLLAPLPPSQKLGHDSLAACPPAKSVGNWDCFVRLRDVASVFNYLTALFHKMCVCRILNHCPKTMRWLATVPRQNNRNRIVCPIAKSPFLESRIWLLAWDPTMAASRLTYRS